MVEYSGTHPYDSGGGSLDVHKSAWQRTLQEMDATATELRDDGWQVVSFPAGHTGPEVPTDGDKDNDRFGLTHIIPGNKVDPFFGIYEDGEFTDYQVFKNTVSGVEFILTTIQDSSSERVLLIAGNYQERLASPLKELAVDREEMYTRIRRLDGTHLASFYHDDHHPFFPDVDD